MIRRKSPLQQACIDFAGYAEVAQNAVQAREFMHKVHDVFAALDENDDGKLDRCYPGQHL